jgi:hypothetical protein
MIKIKAAVQVKACLLLIVYISAQTESDGINSRRF